MFVTLFRFAICADELNPDIRIEKKRKSDEEKSWWELDFDQSHYKFRKLPRHDSRLADDMEE